MTAKERQGALQPGRGLAGVALDVGIGSSPDPSLARAQLSRLSEPSRPLGETEAAALGFVLGASEALGRVMVRAASRWADLFTSALKGGLPSRAEHLSAITGQTWFAEGGPAFAAGLRRYRNEVFLRVGVRDLLGIARVDETMAVITAFAEAALEATVRSARASLAAAYGDVLVDGRPAGFVVLGMGKLGGGELNYSSDVDLVYLYEDVQGQTAGGSRGRLDAREFFLQLGTAVTRTLAELTAEGRVFRVDLRLRPHGSAGPAAHSVHHALAYYESWGQTWERAAYLKARAVAGDVRLGAAFLAEVEPFIYRRYLDFTTLAEMEQMKARIDDERRGRRGNERDVKLGPGGIREAEFVVQALQLVHGGRDPRVRARGTLEALARLGHHGCLPHADAEELAGAYRFLRDVEHKLQILGDRQTHEIPAGGEEALARRLRFHLDGPWGAGAADPVAEFRAARARHGAAVRRAFDGLFILPRDQSRRASGREYLEIVEQADNQAVTAERLRGMGFRDVIPSAQNLRLLRDGPPHAPSSSRRRHMLGELAPALFRAIGRSADPDRALAHMAEFVAAVGARTSFLALLVQNPPTMELLVDLFAASRYLSRFFIRHPELLDSLMRADLVQVEKPRARMAAELAERLETAGDHETRLDVLRRYRNEEFLRIGVNDVHGVLSFGQVSKQLTDLAEVCLEAAVRIAAQHLQARLGVEGPGAFLVLGLGKLGGAELNYNSDLDLIFIYERRPDGPPSPREYYTKLAQTIVSVLQVPTAEGVAYHVDLRLRPSGHSGPLVSSREAFIRYHRRSSRLWERQALVKARAICGPPSLARAVEAAIDRFVYGRGLGEEEVGEIHRLRMRMERELAREYFGRFNIKTGRGGIVDVEFVVQMLQLREGVRRPRVRRRGTLEALEGLHAEHVLPAADYEVLEGGYRFLRGVEHRLRVERDQPVEALEAEGEKVRSVARQMGYTGSDAEAVAALLRRYREVRESVRGVYERWFRVRPEGNGRLTHGA